MKGVCFNRFTFYLLVLFIVVSLSSTSALSSTSGSRRDSSVKFILGEENFGPWKNKITQEALAPSPETDAPSGTLLLAANRTDRPDILRRFRRYRGGWDIANRHYWASVGFTGAAGFILAALWFILFGVALLIHVCCGWGITIKDEQGSHPSPTICLILILLFTCAAV
ncbi:hypothetical protein PIB30_095009 [Stylosanthes scabra]|uniref:Uncharacterized protein n=1 Tax=Stylosanthes scabra TaxID=79078 RepID=A0ABU6WV63_9FABA|nr:hypothetical protein [Stylosanthes scabra]